jgi:hypothetical protein
MGLNLQVKFVPIDKHPDDDVMHLNRFRKTDRLTGQSLDPRPSCQMFPLDLLRIAFARLVCIRLEMTQVGAPVVRIVSPDTKRLQQLLALQEDLVPATAKDICQDLAAAVIDRVPEPSLLFFLADKRPHFIHFCFLNAPNDYFHLIRIQQREEAVIHTAERRFFFCSALMTVVGLSFSTRAVSRMPLPLRAATFVEAIKLK